jgi:multidrug efflux pump subunit AcrB
MTALAMIIGMLPMARRRRAGLGEGGEQNAPLGRAGDRRPDLRDRRSPR